MKWKKKKEGRENPNGFHKLNWIEDSLYTYKVFETLSADWSGCRCDVLLQKHGSVRSKSIGAQVTP